jgi:hypothetical protein
MLTSLAFAGDVTALASVGGLLVAGACEKGFERERDGPIG